MLLHGSETWVLSKTALASLEGFHIRAVYWMARRHKPQRDPWHKWIHPKSKDVFEECGMHTLEEYIQVCWQTITVYVITRLILTKCRQGKQKIGAVPHHWWWEQQMDLDTMMQLDQASDGPVYALSGSTEAGNAREQLGYCNRAAPSSVASSFE
jgi:hypothetical protein